MVAGIPLKVKEDIEILNCAIVCQISYAFDNLLRVIRHIAIGEIQQIARLAILYKVPNGNKVKSPFDHARG